MSKSSPRSILTVLVADVMLKDKVMSTASGYNGGEVNTLPPPLKHLSVRDEMMLQEDVREVPDFRSGDEASRPYVKRAACMSKVRTAAEDWERDGMWGYQPRRSITSGGAVVRNLGRENRRSGGAARAED